MTVLSFRFLIFYCSVVRVVLICTPKLKGEFFMVTHAKMVHVDKKLVQNITYLHVF